MFLVLLLRFTGVFVFASRRRHTRYWSDWSSDVCSSDLGFFEFYEQCTPIREIGALKIASRPVYRSGRVRDIKDLRAIQIGRASCRERVKISVVAVSLKKTRH